VSGELLKSNTTNNRSLGGQQPRGNAADDDEDPNSYEVNMERIMAKFTNFNSSSQDSNQDDDDEDEEEEKGEEFTGHQEEEDSPDFSHLDDMPRDKREAIHIKAVEARIKEDTPLV
jgi:hypothetical protein